MNKIAMDQLAKIAAELDEAGEFGLADEVEEVLGEFIATAAKAKAKKKERGEFAVPVGHPKNKSNKGHYPLSDMGRGRNALARVNQYDGKAPPWWKGTVQELTNTVVRAVKKKFPGISVSKKSTKPGKG